MQSADNIVFATPVYWYAMSGRMKIFFDRFTDLLYTHKSIGKNLKGKKLFICKPFKETFFEINFLALLDKYNRTCPYAVLPIRPEQNPLTLRLLLKVDCQPAQWL